MKNHISLPDAVDCAQQVKPMRTINQKKHRGVAQAAAPTTDTGASVSDTKWVRLPVLEDLRGIKKGTAYNLIHTGQIKSVRLPNAPTEATAKTEPKKSTKGVRLVFLPSVDEFLNRLSQEQNPAVGKT